MNDYDFELEKELASGNFKRIDLDKWFKTYQYNYIYYAIQGCDKVINKEVLDFIITYADMLLTKSIKTTNYDRKEIVFNCEYLLTQAIVVGCRHFEDYKCIISRLVYSENERVSLYCQANLPLAICKRVDYPTERIEKIRNIRHEFYYCWNEGLFSDITKESILYLAKALELKVINCSVSESYISHLEFSSVTISSLLFESDLYVPIFDMDVLYTIQDKRILGYCLNKLIEDEYLKFRDECYLHPRLRNEMESHINTNKIKVKRPSAIATFNKMYKVSE